MIIGINGYKGAGKDTVGKILIRNYGFERMAFADIMKKSLAALWGIHVEAIENWKNDPDVYVQIVRDTSDDIPPLILKKWTFRDHSKRYGTESHRDVLGEDIWVDAAFPDYWRERVHTWHTGKKYVVTDCRFINEMEAINDCGGFVFRVERPGFESDGHASEAMPPAELIFHTIHNDSDMHFLEWEVRKVMNMLLEGDI